MVAPMSEPREELNELLNGALEVASELLEKDGEFEPFALALRNDGEILHLSNEDGDGETPPEDAVEALRAELREARADYRAVAIVADVTLEDDDSQAVSSAVHVSMEHAVEAPVTCYVPYEFEGETLTLGDLVGEPGESAVFDPATPN